ncbi:hypothetical protein Nmel_002171 [Mimus melanotis]
MNAEEIQLCSLSVAINIVYHKKIILTGGNKGFGRAYNISHAQSEQLLCQKANRNSALSTFATFVFNMVNFGSGDQVESLVCLDHKSVLPSCGESLCELGLYLSKKSLSTRNFKHLNFCFSGFKLCFPNPWSLFSVSKSLQKGYLSHIFSYKQNSFLQVYNYKLVIMVFSVSIVSVYSSFKVGVVLHSVTESHFSFFPDNILRV